MSAILGFKKGMIQIFSDGKAIPCTVIDVSKTKIVGKCTKDANGYNALIIGIDEKKKASNAEKGKFKDLKIIPRFSKEFRIDNVEVLAEKNIGDDVNIEDFKVGDKVKISGLTKGKGFQGVVRRWGFHGGSHTHGQSDRERGPGAISSGTMIGRVYKGKKMAGHMGNKRKTILNMKIVKVDKENGIICVKGGVPGHKNTLLEIHS